MARPSVLFSRTEFHSYPQCPVYTHDQCVSLCGVCVMGRKLAPPAALSEITVYTCTPARVHVAGLYESMWQALLAWSCATCSTRSHASCVIAAFHGRQRASGLCACTAFYDTCKGTGARAGVMWPTSCQFSSETFWR